MLYSLCHRATFTVKYMNAKMASCEARTMYYLYVNEEAHKIISFVCLTAVLQVNQHWTVATLPFFLHPVPKAYLCRHLAKVIVQVGCPFSHTADSVEGNYNQ